MIPTVIKIDLSKKPWDLSGGEFHNRFHPEIPSVVTVRQGEIFKVECYDSRGGQIENSDNLSDFSTLEPSYLHVLSGPICVEDCKPGDILEVELLDIQPHPEMMWGYTCIFPPNLGGAGVLANIFTKPAKCIWDFEGIHATSRHIPRVRFPGIMHPGIIATAPSKALLAEWNRRENVLAKTAVPSRIPPLAYLPEPNGALLGRLDLNEWEAAKVKTEAARTIAPRETGGNADIKNLHKGAKIWLPVYVQGANLSVGDTHFSQGDGEMSLCGAIETAGILTLRTKVIKNGMSLYGVRHAPLLLPGLVEPRFSKYLTFEGINVEDNGQQRYIDPALSYRQAALSAIEYLQKFGYSPEQIYLLLSACPIESHLASAVNIPNSLVTIGIPADVFDFDIEPKEHGPVLQVIGSHPPFVSRDSAKSNDFCTET